MTSLRVQDICYGVATDSPTTLKPQLLRLTRSIRERSASRDPSSLDFVKSGLEVLHRVEPAICRIECYESLAAAIPYLFAHAEMHTASRASELMCRLAARLERKDLLRQAENFAGIITRNRGDMTGALVHYQRALSLAQELDDRNSEALVLNNLASILIEVGCYSEAENCCKRVFQFGGEELRVARSSCYHNLATLMSRTGRHQEALEAARKSFAEIPESNTIFECYSRAMREAAFIYIAVSHAGKGELDRHLASCRYYAERGGTRPSLAFLQLANALCVLASGAFRDGVAQMEGVLDQSRRLGHSGLHEDALAALVWAYERHSQPANALGHLRALIAHIVERRGQLLSEQNRVTRVDAAHDLMPLMYEEAKLETAAMKQEARAARIEMLQRVAMAATLKDDPSGMHGYRVGRLSALLAEKIGWDKARCYQLEMASRLHDIGKSAVPDHVLLKSAPLKGTDRNLVEAHPQIGVSLLTQGADADSRLAAEIALYHHEHWDGTGYPKQISEGRIPISARIAAIADVFDALAHGRPYASAWPLEKVLAEITSQSGRQFDPGLVAPFVQLVTELTSRHGGLDRCLQAGEDALPFMQARRHIAEMLSSMH